jgi:hypothetical protein
MGTYHCDMQVVGNYLHIATFNEDGGEYQIIKLAEVNKIAIAADNQTANKANFAQFSAKGIGDYLDSEQELEDVTKSVNWDTSDHNVAVINAQGAMFTYRAGKVDVIAAYLDGERTITGKTAVVITEDKKAKKAKLDNAKIKEFLPLFLDKAAGEASEADLHVIYDVLAKSHKLDLESEKIKKSIILDLENRKIKKSILDEIIKKKDNIKDKTFIEDVIELHDEL